MNRYARKRDANQGEITKALEAIGAFVVDLSRVGGGIPDMMVAYRGQTILVECKNEDGLNIIGEKQRDFLELWKNKGGPCLVVRTAEEAVLEVAAIGR